MYGKRKGNLINILENNWFLLAGKWMNKGVNFLVVFKGATKIKKGFQMEVGRT